MKDEIYKSIIKNSKISYLKIKCKKNCHNKYTEIEVIEQSSEFEKFFKILTENNISNKHITELIINNWINNKFKNYEFNDFIEDIINDGYKRLKYTSQSNDKKIILDIYYLGDYFILVYNFDCGIEYEKKADLDVESFKEIAKYSDSIFIIRDEKRAIYVSPAFRNVFEEEPDNLYKDINKLDEYFTQAKCNNSNIQYKFNFDKYNEGISRVKLINGKEKWIWYKSIPIKDLKGNRTKVLEVLTDITENKKVEEEKKQIKLDFFADISHDLRTPVNLISSTIQLIKLKLNKLPSQDSNKISEYINIMETNSLRLIKLINNLIDSTKIDAGFISFNPINSDIIRFIESVCDSTVEYALFNKMNLIFDTDSEEEIVLFDPDIIERVLLNLLSNAVKFNKPNKNIYVNIYTKNDKITISVKDEGIGIPKEKIKCIFTRFEQVNNKNKIEKQGSGIGLYLVKSLVTLHGGEIEVRSKVNEGSEFIVSIPKKVLDNEKEFVIKNEENRCYSTNIEFSDI